MLNLCLDSGAFSAFTQKKSINLDEYCNFSLTNAKYFSKVVNLDVIDPQGPEVAAAAGMANFHQMLDRGINAMPVFHARERRKWLDEMLELTDYIGLSGTSLVSPVEDRAWHRFIWDYVTDNAGYPIAKFHSFGNTSPYMLLTMPFFTADSATWMIQAGRAGRVKLQGKSYQIRSHSIGDNNYISIDDTGPKRESWEYEISELGLDPNALMNVKAKGSELAMLRSFLVAADLLKLQELSTNVTKFVKPNTLLHTKKQQTGGFERQGPCQIYFVISPSAYYFNFPVIHALGIKNILVSYYYIITATKTFWDETLVPFIMNPEEFINRDPKCRRFNEKLNEVLLKPALV